MSLSLTNRDDIIANSYSPITSNGSVVVFLDAVQGSVVGLPPASLNTIEKLSSAVSNDPNYFQTMQTSVDSKADQSTTYTKDEVNAFLDGKPDDAELTAVIDAINTQLDAKQHKFIVALIPANTGRLFDVNSTKFRAINVASPLGITTPNYGYLTISCDSYTKAESDSKISALVGAAPALLNTLVELSAALNDDATYATTITNALNATALLASPALTGTATAVNLTVSGNLITGTTNVLTSLNSNATTTDLNLKAPITSPALIGTATAVNLTVSGNLINGTTNVLTTLNIKANTASPALTGIATAAALTVSGNLLVGTTNVLTELDTKATTTNLNLKTDRSTTDNSAVAWSTGTAAGYHNLQTGTETLAIYTPNNYIAMSIQGTAGGIANEGRIQGLQDIDISAVLKVNNVDIATTFSGKQTTLISATAVGAQFILTSSIIKCLKTVGNLSMTADATTITLTGSSNIPILTTGKIIASSGTREGGLAWTGMSIKHSRARHILHR
jgi:hypothetical protein